MTTTTLSHAAKRARLRESGLSDVEIDAIIGPEQTAETDVRPAESKEAAEKYGVTSIFKVFANGHAKNKMALRTASAHVTLIQQLQDRYAELPDAKKFVPFALEADNADES